MNQSYTKGRRYLATNTDGEGKGSGKCTSWMEAGSIPVSNNNRKTPDVNPGTDGHQA